MLELTNEMYRLLPGTGGSMRSNRKPKSVKEIEAI